MADIFSKELVQMIEERIPGGRFLTTTALLLALLALIVGSCVYLYQHVIFPLVKMIIAGFTAGKIDPAAFAGFLGSMVCAGAIYWAMEWLHRGSSRLMREVLDNAASVNRMNAEVLAVSENTNRGMGGLVNELHDLETRIQTLEGKVIDKQ